MAFTFGDYTYALEGGSTIVLDDLLWQLGEAIAENQPADSKQLLILADDMSQIESIIFTNADVAWVGQV